MERLYIDLGEKGYPIYIGKKIVQNLREYLKPDDQYFIVTDEVVEGLYGKELGTDLDPQKGHRIILPIGEEHKNMGTAIDVLNKMIDAGMTRKSKVIAFGGGVVGDMAGFCASIYMRGIEWIQIPTTLLAQVDSSVGGKTGVNMPQGKNLIGSFYQPNLVIIDVGFLKTLDQKQRLSGIGEVIKYGVMADYEFLKYIETNLDSILSLEEGVMRYIIGKCLQIKAKVVTLDQKEIGIRKNLNLGHTIGHAIEAATDYREYSHGEAVLIGMYYEAQMANVLGMINREYVSIIQGLIKNTGVCLDISKIQSDRIKKALKSDKKNKDNKISFILPRAPGQVEEVLLPEERILPLIF